MTGNRRAVRAALPHGLPPVLAGLAARGEPASGIRVRLEHVAGHGVDHTAGHLTAGRTIQEARSFREKALEDIRADVEEYASPRRAERSARGRLPRSDHGRGVDHYRDSQRM